MSWIEKPPNEIVGKFNLSNLAIDEAFINVSSSVSNQLWLYELSSNCFKCPYRLASDISEFEATERRISTKFPTYFRIRTSDEPQYVPKDNDSDIFCDIKYDLGEFGVYNIHASENNNVPHCNVEVAAEPVNIYYPLLLACFFYIVLFTIISIISSLRKRRSARLPSESSLSTVTSNNTNSNGSRQPNESQAEPVIQSKGASNGSPSNSNPQAVPNQNQTARASQSPPRQKQRLRSLDAFRGFCITTMIFVNDGGAGYYFFDHATWDGLYIADLVFPWFLWIMGVCIPIAIKSQVKRGISRLDILSSIASRSIKLIAIGLLLSSQWGPIQFGENANLRIPGILQRFGVCYFVCATLVLFSMTVNITKPESSKLKAMFQDIGILGLSWLVVLLIVVIHCLITFRLPVEGCPTGYLGPGGLHNSNSVAKHCIGGAAGYLDLQIFTRRHVFQFPTAKAEYDSDVYDPEGFLGTLTSILQVWIGVQTGATMLVYPRAKSRLIRWGIWAVLTGALGATLSGGQETGWWIPINKNIWSLSFVFVTTCFALVLLSLFYIIIDIKHYWSGSPFFEPGMNSILLYFGHSIFHKTLPWHWAVGLMSTHFIRLIESLWGTTLWVLIALYLHHKKLYWSV